MFCFNTSKFNWVWPSKSREIPAHFTFHFTTGGAVTIIFGAARTKFHNMVARLKFIGKITQKVTQRRIHGRIVRCLQKHDRVCVGIEASFLQMIKGLIQSQACMARGEGRDKNVQMRRTGFTERRHFVIHFDAFFVQGADPANIMLVTVQETPKLDRVDEFFDLGLVVLSPELPSHGIEHKLGQCTLTRVLGNVFGDSTMPSCSYEARQ